MEFQLSTMFTFLIIISTTVLPPSTTTGHPIPPTSDATNYIRTSCKSTLYPETCFTTLSKYSGSINDDPKLLAMSAINVALTAATQTANYVSDIHRHLHDNSTESAAVSDCTSVLGDAVDEILQSQKEMKQLGKTGDSLRLQLSNVQTWMSAALTNDDTCIDGFDDVEGGDVKAKVCARVVAVKEVTSNALALVNKYADTIGA